MPNLTAREKIQKHAKVKRLDNGGDALIAAGRRLNMNKTVAELTDDECQRVVDYMGLDAYITEHENSTKSQRTTELGENRKAALKPNSKPCECGCGEITSVGKQFRPGHDMRLKSTLRKAAKAGDAKAQEELKRRGWA